MNYILTICKDILLYVVLVGIDSENTVTIVIDCWKNYGINYQCSIYYRNSIDNLYKMMYEYIKGHITSFSYSAFQN